MNKRILQLAVPSIISNITVPLLGLVDVAIVGHIGDAAYIGAIAVGSMLFNVIYWLFGFLRMGTSGMTSQALGRRDLAEVLRLLVRSLSIGVGIGVLFFVLQKWLIGCGLWAMSPEADVVELARRYCYVCIWGAPAVLGLYGFTGWFIGMQNTRIPMMVSLTQFFSLNKDIFLRTLCLVAVNLFFTAAGSRESTIVLAVNTLLMTLFTIFSYFMDGFAYAAEALSGKYYGARNMGAFREVVRRTMGFGAVVAFVFDGIFVGITQSKSMLCSTAVASASFFGLFFGLHPFLGNHALWLAFILYLLLRGIVLFVIYRKKLR